MATQYPSYDDIQEIRRTLREATNEHWLYNDLFRGNWWLNLVLTFVPWIIWWKIVDKEKVFQILTYGLLVSILSILLDIIGVNLVWWGYPDKLLPMVPPVFPIDITIVPIINMLLYQYFPTWKSFLKAKIVVAAAYSFIFEPVLVKMNLYALHTWKHWYSFPTYIIMALSLRWVVGLILHLSTNQTEKQTNN